MPPSPVIILQYSQSYSWVTTDKLHSLTIHCPWYGTCNWRKKRLWGYNINYLAQTLMCSFLFLQDPNSGFSFQCSHQHSDDSTHFALDCSHSGGICQQETKLQFSRTSLKFLSPSANQQLMDPLKWQELLTKKQQTLEILDDQICYEDRPKLTVPSPHINQPWCCKAKEAFQLHHTCKSK